MKRTLLPLHSHGTGFGHRDRPVVHNVAYHTTPATNLPSILAHGLLPAPPSRNEPCAVYLAPRLSESLLLARLLNAYRVVNIRASRGDYLILEVDVRGLPLYRDPRSVQENGVYHEGSVSADRIRLVGTLPRAVINSQDNWSTLWSWLTEHGDKPAYVDRFDLGFCEAGKVEPTPDKKPETQHGVADL